MSSTSPTLATWLLEQESRALLRRLDRVKPFVLQETMVPAAGVMPAGQSAIEGYLLDGRRRLRTAVREFIRWLQGPGRNVPPEIQQRRFVFLRLRFNTALTELDMFSEALSQRSEHETGVWLSGLDVAAQDALSLPGFFVAPPVICYLHRGLGGAIRRARTRLPGGGENPVSIVRIPRERMIGFGIASSLAHECGHQAAALLGLVESLRPQIQGVRRASPPTEALAWTLWERWISEVVADVWALAKIGISSSLGLVGIVSLPRPFVFRVAVDDPHPFPWIRVVLSCAVGNALYPHRQWEQLAATWRRLYPIAGLDAERSAIIEALGSTLSRFVSLLMRHRPPSLRGAELGATIRLADRSPDRLIALFERWEADPELIGAAPPTLIFAVFGRARAKGRLTPEREDRLLGRLITQWAVRSTLDIAATWRPPAVAQPETPKPTPPIRVRAPAALPAARQLVRT